MLDLRSRSGQSLIHNLRYENKEDIHIMFNWLKENTLKALNDSSFYEVYRSVKECYEESVERDSYLYNILVRLNYDLSSM